MSNRKTYHVTPNSGGGWKVKLENAPKAFRICDTKAEAIGSATEVAKNQVLGQVVIHKRDMTIQEERTYGKDPFPPRG
jgi:hypothetical protein